MIIRKVQPKKYINLRIIATLIDYTIFIFFVVAYIYIFGHKDDSGDMTVDGLAAIPLMMLWFLYFVITEAVNQSTPGHDICKLTVVKTNGGKIGISDAFKRRVLDFADFGVYGIPALVCINKTSKFQRLGDLLADTLVVKKSDIYEEEVSF